MVFNKKGWMYVANEIGTCDYCNSKATFYVKVITVGLSVKHRELCKKHQLLFTQGEDLEN